MWYRPCLFLLASFFFHTASAKVYTYPIPHSAFSLSQDFSFKAGNSSVDVIRYKDYDYAHFSMDSTTTLEITKLNKDSVGSYQISPKKFFFDVTITDNAFSFSMTEPQYLIIQVDSQKPLVILADPAEVNPPSANDKSVLNVANAPYSADTTGNDYATKPIQDAIDAASKKGGGTVYVPAGLYKSGNIVIDSNVNLYLEGGAVLEYTGDPSVYQKWGMKNGKCMTFWVTTAENSTGGSLTGRGTIWGNGKATLAPKHNCFATLLEPMATSNFTFDGPILKEGSFWHFNVFASKDITINNAKVLGRFDMGENDGIDITESQGVRVTRAFAAIWDDCFSTKSYDPGASGTYAGTAGDVFRTVNATPQAVKDVVFDNILGWTGLYGMKVGAGNFQDQGDITFQNGVVYDCSAGIGIDHVNGPAKVSNVTFKNIEVEKVSTTVQGHRSWLHFNISDHTGAGPVSDINVQNITLHDLGRTPSTIQGHSPKADFGNITFAQIYVQSLGRQAHTLQELNVQLLGNVAGPVGGYYTDGPNNKQTPFPTGPGISSSPNTGASQPPPVGPGSKGPKKKNGGGPPSLGLRAEEAAVAAGWMGVVCSVLIPVLADLTAGRGPGPGPGCM